MYGGKISFDEFVQVQTDGLKFMAGETVQIRVGECSYTTAEIVRREA
jgi:hypothetical protein